MKITTVAEREIVAQLLKDSVGSIGTRERDMPWSDGERPKVIKSLLNAGLITVHSGPTELFYSLEGVEITLEKQRVPTTV